MAKLAVESNIMQMNNAQNLEQRNVDLLSDSVLHAESGNF
jgi:hypothetical protein